MSSNDLFVIDCENNNLLNVQHYVKQHLHNSLIFQCKCLMWNFLRRTSPVIKTSIIEGLKTAIRRDHSQIVRYVFENAHLDHDYDLQQIMIDEALSHHAWKVIRYFLFPPEKAIIVNQSDILSVLSLAVEDSQHDIEKHLREETECRRFAENSIHNAIFEGAVKGNRLDIIDMSLFNSPKWYWYLINCITMAMQHSKIQILQNLFGSKYWSKVMEQCCDLRKQWTIFVFQNSSIWKWFVNNHSVVDIYKTIVRAGRYRDYVQMVVDFVSDFLQSASKKDKTELLYLMIYHDGCISHWNWCEVFSSILEYDCAVNELIHLPVISDIVQRRQKFQSIVQQCFQFIFDKNTTQRMISSHMGYVFEKPKFHHTWAVFFQNPNVTFR